MRYRTCVYFIPILEEVALSTALLARQTFFPSTISYSNIQRSGVVPPFCKIRFASGIVPQMRKACRDNLNTQAVSYPRIAVSYPEMRKACRASYTAWKVHFLACCVVFDRGRMKYTLLWFDEVPSRCLIQTFGCKSTWNKCSIYSPVFFQSVS